MDHIIRRTERVRELRELLGQKRALYLSAFFYAGKTVLLDQLAEALEGEVLRFDMARDDWETFAARVDARDSCTLLIDSLHLLSDVNAEALAGMIARLKPGQRAVLAGRAQLPSHLRELCATGVITLLGKDFVLMDVEEIRQLFLEYGVTLKAEDATWLKQAAWGWPLVLHMTAQELVRQPDRPLQDIREEAAKSLWDLLIQKVVMSFPDPERTLLFNLSPFEAFTEEMARMLTGIPEAGRLMDGIAQKSYMLLQNRDGRYGFIPFVRNALFNELKRRQPTDYIDNQYRRAALYYELQNDIPNAIRYYRMLGDREKLRQLLILDTHRRPSNGDYVELKPAYDMLSEAEIAASPELMKGICFIESMCDHVEQSEYWYSQLKRFIEKTPASDAMRRTAQEAAAYLDIGLPHRGTGHTLNILLATARLGLYTNSDSWRSGFNVAGNSVSLMNGGKDFSRWNPHGKNLYRLFKAPVELALGRGGSGMADIAIGECLLESSLDGDYGEAWKKVGVGLSRAADDIEMQCAATGIQARIAMAQGDISGASDMLKNRLATLPETASKRLRQNLECAYLTYELMRGKTSDALAWLTASAPDETGEFVILDRYRYMLKLRLYIITDKWLKTKVLVSRLADYFDRYQRPYMRAQLYLLEALIDRRTGRETWREKAAAGLALARRYRLARLIADEGIAALDMLSELHLPDDPWTKGVLELTRIHAARCPKYMKSVTDRPLFSDREYQVYSLMIAGMTNGQIGRLLNITERAVKYHVSEIFRKLNVKNRAQVMLKAVELGDI